MTEKTFNLIQKEYDIEDAKLLVDSISFFEKNRIISFSYHNQDLDLEQLDYLLTVFKTYKNI